MADVKSKLDREGRKVLGRADREGEGIKGIRDLSGGQNKCSMSN